MRSLQTLLYAVLLAAAASSTAPAAILSVAKAGSGTVPSVDTSFGTFQTALNFGGLTTTNNGISFVGTPVADGDPSSASVASSPFGVEVSAATGLRNDTNIIAADPLFGSEIWSTSQVPISLIVSGLNPALTYQFQFLHGEGRGMPYSNGTVTFTDSTSDTDSTSLTFGTTGNLYVIVTVEVAGTTSLTYDMPTASRGPSYSGMAIYAVPEPSAMIALATGLICLLPSARRAARSFGRSRERARSQPGK